MAAMFGCYPDNNSALFDDNGGANLNPVEEINHLVIHHANATRGNRPANAPGLGCAVNPVFGIADIKGTCTQRIFRTADHEGRNDVALFGFPFDHDLRGVPIGPCRLAGDFVLARPGITFAADAYWIHDGFVVLQNEVEASLAGTDENGTRCHGFKKVYNPAGCSGVFLRAEHGSSLPAGHAAINLEGCWIELYLPRENRCGQHRATGSHGHHNTYTHTQSPTPA